MHPNKHGDTFRQLVAGAAAFNAVSRSSLLLAQHPDSDTRRALIRGKGNLARNPTAVEFTLAERQFDANGHTFKVPVAEDFNIGALTVEDLIGATAATAEHSKVRDACEIIAALLPRDGNWHPAKPIKAACAAEQLDERTAQRAKDRLHLEHKRADEFPAPTLWRWPSPDTHTTPSTAVASVATVASANGHAAPLTTTHDTHDTHDSANDSRECVASGTDWTDDDLEALIDRHTEALG
jgi:hypothetical protein